MASTRPDRVVESKYSISGKLVEVRLANGVVIRPKRQIHPPRAGDVYVSKKHRKGYGQCPLTAKESRIIALVAEGLKNEEIGAMLGLRAQVVKNYLRVIFDKCGVWNRLELALWAVSREVPVEEALMGLA